MKVYLSSIGCRLNQSEIEGLAHQLLAQGHEIVNTPSAADKVVINTCAVTAEAAKDARSQARRFNQQNPDAAIYLTGCYATIAPEEVEKINDAVQVVSNQQKNQLIQILDPDSQADQPLFEREPVMREYLSRQLGNTRAFVKVQDGCDNRCTFCITTVARGAGTSRALGDVIAEIQALGSAGYQEVVLTGVHLGSYGKDLGADINLQKLIQSILAYTDIPRLRISSLEPWDIPPRFFELWQNPRLLPHLHLPLQSGSDRILRLMARRTTQHDFRSLVTAARDSISDLNISTDMIMGFPGETESDYAGSLAFVKEINFARLHVFTYSARPGTAAARMPDQLPKTIKKERTRNMIELGKKLSLAFNQGFVGSERPVLWEAATGANNDGLLWSGYTDNYIRVTANGPVDLFNVITPARLDAALAEGFAGSLPQTSPI